MLCLATWSTVINVSILHSHLMWLLLAKLVSANFVQDACRWIDHNLLPSLKLQAGKIPVKFILLSYFAAKMMY